MSAICRRAAYNDKNIYMRSKLLLTVRIIVGLFAVFSGVVGYFIYTNTLISLRDAVLIPLTVVTVAAPLIYKKWKWVTDSDNKLLNLVCHFLLGGCIVFGAFMLGNIPIGSDVPTFEEKTVVQKKATTKSRNTRRVGRRSYVTTGYRTNYHLWVALHDSVSRKHTVKREAYNRVRTGDTVTVVLSKGRFGYQFIKKVKVPKRTLNKKRRRNKIESYALHKLRFHQPIKE